MIMITLYIDNRRRTRKAAQQPVRSSARLPHYFPPSRVRWLLVIVAIITMLTIVIMIIMIMIILLLLLIIIIINS